jgi:glutamyl-tRNA synthetase
MTHELSLPGDTSGVVMRFAPNPNGPPTLGHARGIIINAELVRKYNGRLILRFDDTDPKTKRPLPEAYGWYVDDCKWLGFNPDLIVECSSQLLEYYKNAEDLIKLGKAYVCECSKERFKECKDAKRACMHRDKTPEENLEGWRMMLSGGYQEGGAVLRIKTNLAAQNPAERDWVAFRIVKEPHPKVGSKYNAWPMLDFAGAIEDHLLGVTHIIRGKDLADSGKRQQYVYDYLGWTYPNVLHWGRIKVVEDVEETEAEGEEEEGEKVTKLSTSRIARAIQEGLYTGWDDPQLHTLMALRRRGITADAIRNLMLSLGLSESDISVSMENLYAENRKVLDKTANRYFFVEDPVEVTLENPPKKTVRIPLHPSFKERGVREQVLAMEGTTTRIYISKKDAELLDSEGSVKLIGLPCIQKKGAGKNTLTAVCLIEGKDAKAAQAQKIQWVQDHIPAEILMNDRPSSQPKMGYCEKACQSLKEGDIIQFERFGFCRLDRKEKDRLVFCFGHQ